MEGSRPAATLTLWGKRFFSPLLRRPRYEAHLASGLFDHITIKIMWRDWKHQDKVKTEHRGRTGENPVLHWEICNHNEFISQMSLKRNLQLWNDTKLKNFFLWFLTHSWRCAVASCSQHETQTLGTETGNFHKLWSHLLTAQNPNREFIVTKVSPDSRVAVPLCSAFWLLTLSPLAQQGGATTLWC